MVLVAYLSKAGSTKEVAEEIGKIFNTNGIETDIKELTAVQNLDRYSGIIVGAPINGFRWLPEAEKFIEDNKERLKNLPTSYFMLSYLLKTGRDSLKKKMKNTLSKAKTIVTPVSTGLFGGKVDKNFPAVARVMFGVKKEAPLDARDWDEIRAWATELAGSYQKQ